MLLRKFSVQCQIHLLCVTKHPHAPLLLKQLIWALPIHVAKLALTGPRVLLCLGLFRHHISVHPEHGEHLLARRDASPRGPPVGLCPCFWVHSAKWFVGFNTSSPQCTVCHTSSALVVEHGCSPDMVSWSDCIASRKIISIFFCQVDNVTAITLLMFAADETVAFLPSKGASPDLLDNKGRPFG